MTTRSLINLYAIVCIFLLSGCSILNPYKGSFECPDYNNGKCTSVKNAYEEDIGRKQAGMVPDKSKGDSKVTSVDPRGSETEYQKEVYGKLSRLLKSPKTPMVAPPKVMRVLLMPYKGDNSELYMSRYAYFMVDDPKWIMGDYLTDDPTMEDD